MKHYVAGFLINHDRDKVVMIQKNRPEWQAGKYNGVGGKIEPGEDPWAAQSREFWEETGVMIPAYEWTLGLTINVPTHTVNFFRAFAPCETLYKVRSMTDEQVRVCQFPEILGPNATYKTIPNLQWIIPLLLDPEMAVNFHTLEANE